MGSSRIAAVFLPELSLEAAFGVFGSLKETPDWRKKRVATESPGKVTRIVAVNQLARTKGVLPGMSKVEAKARVPKLEIRPQQRERERELLESAAEVLLSLSSMVEVSWPNCICVEISRSMSRLASDGLMSEDQICEFVLEQLSKLGHVAQVVVADEVDTAKAWYRGVLENAKGSSFKVIPSGTSAEALRDLPISSLVFTDAVDDAEGRVLERLRSVQSSLRVVGAETVSHLLSLPREQVKSRFGDAGVMLVTRALGERHRPLIPFVLKETMLEFQTLEPPLADLEPMTFLLKRMFDRLESRLQARGSAATRVEVRIWTEPSSERVVSLSERSSLRELTSIELPLARPTRSASSMLRICREKVMSRLPGAVVSIEIEAKSPVADGGAQLDLFSRRMQNEEKVEELLARLELMLGERSVFAGELISSHRPESAWQARPFLVDLAFQEPTVRPSAPRAHPFLERSGQRVSLPEVSVVSVLAIEAASKREIREEPRLEARAPWPKPVRADPGSEPVAPLPPRPLVLLERPEPAELHEEVLSWRGQDWSVADLAGREALEAEWWTSDPLIREYMILTTIEGRKLWIFRDRDGKYFVHGLFD